jgi:hypothetical protein
MKPAALALCLTLAAQGALAQQTVVVTDQPIPPAVLQETAGPVAPKALIPLIIFGLLYIAFSGAGD